MRRVSTSSPSFTPKTPRCRAGPRATSGETATRLGFASAPAIAEAIAIARDVRLAETAGARLHVHQVTTAEGVDVIRRARIRGVKVTCGTSPAYLLLNDDAAAGYRTFSRLSPPLRAESDRLALLAAFADGSIDCLTSAHDPRTQDDKRLPFGDAEAWHGGRGNAIGARHFGCGRLRHAAGEAGRPPDARTGDDLRTAGRLARRTGRLPISCCSMPARRGESMLRNLSRAATTRRSTGCRFRAASSSRSRAARSPTPLDGASGALCVRSLASPRLRPCGQSTCYPSDLRLLQSSPASAEVANCRPTGGSRPCHRRRCCSSSACSRRGRFSLHEALPSDRQKLRASHTSRAAPPRRRS